jgi:hypothetical protein
MTRTILLAVAIVLAVAMDMHATRRCRLVPRHHHEQWHLCRLAGQYGPADD